MSEAPRKVLDAALALDGPDRALVAAELIASLDGSPDADVEAAWADEIARRIGEIEAGTAELAPWEEARHRIGAAIHRKPLPRSR